MRRPGAVLGAAIAWAIVARPGYARADDVVVPVRVDYRGAEGCPEPSAFLRELTAHGARVRAAGALEPALVLVVTLTRGAGSAVHGRLVVEDVDGATSRRDVDGASCESVVGALALMGALVVDPTAPPPGDRPPPPQAPVAPPEASPADDAPRSGVARGGSSVRLAISAGAGATLGTAPSVAWTLPVVGEIGWGAEGRVRPVLRVGFEHDDSGLDAATGGDASFVLNAGTLDGCLSLPLIHGVTFLPCARAEAGAIHAVASNIVPARSDARPWVDVGPLGALRATVLSPFFAELSVGVRVPLIRDRFYFEPDTTVFRPPPLAGLVGGAVGVAFP